MSLARPLVQPEVAGRTGPGRWVWVAVTTLAVAAGMILRWYRLGAQSLWFDEGYTAWVASLPARQIVRVVRVDTAPPLYYLVLSVWARVAGHSEAGLRSLSALCGTASLGVAVLIARRIYQRPIAVSAAVVAVAFSSMQVGYAHEARFYEMMGLAGLVDFYAMLRACESEQASPAWLAVTAASVGVSVWLNNLLVIYAGCLAIAWLVAPGRRPVRGRAGDVAVVVGCVVLIYAPWIGTALAQARAVGEGFWIARPSGAVLLRVLGQVAGADRPLKHRMLGPLFDALVVAVGLLLGTAIVLGRRRRAGAALAVYGLLPVGVLFVVSRLGHPLFIDRAFIVSSAVVPLLLPLPLDLALATPHSRRLASAGWQVVSTVLLAALLLNSVRSSFAARYGVPKHLEDWRDACRYAARVAGRNGRVVFSANEGELLFDYYTRPGDFTTRPQLIGVPADFFALDPPQTLQRVTTDAQLNPLRQQLARDFKTPVVLVSAHDRRGPGGEALILPLFRQHQRQLSRRAFGSIFVYVFAG